MAMMVLWENNGTKNTQPYTYVNEVIIAPVTFLKIHHDHSVFTR